MRIGIVWSAEALKAARDRLRPAGAARAGLVPQQVTTKSGHTQTYWVRGDKTPDPAKRRRADEASKRSRPLADLITGSAPKPAARPPGVHHDDETNRWVHVPHEPHHVGGDAEVADIFNEQDSKEVTRRNVVRDALDEGVLEFRHERGGSDHALLVPDASEPGRHRISFYDERGFAGHRTYDTAHEAADAAADAGYHIRAPGSLDKLASTDAWAQGTRDTRVNHISSALRAAGHHEVERQMMAHYHESGRTEDALQRIEGDRDALMRGAIPDSIRGEGAKADLGLVLIRRCGAAERPEASKSASVAPDARVHVDPPPEPNREPFPYQGTIDFQGLRILVENLRGTQRRGVDADGHEWATTMPAHYGEFADTIGADGDPIDVFVGAHRHAHRAYVVAIGDVESGRYDEDKVFVGFDRLEDVLRCFAEAYDRNGMRHGRVRAMTISELREWLEDRRREGKRITGGVEMHKAHTDAAVGGTRPPTAPSAPRLVLHVVLSEGMKAWDPSKHPRDARGRFRSSAPSVAKAEGTPRALVDALGSEHRDGRDASVVVEDVERVMEVARTLLGEEVTKADLAALVGAGPGDRVKIRADSDALEIFVDGPEESWGAIRVLHGEGGRPVMENTVMSVTETGQGLGARIFGSQVANAAAAGVARLECDAAAGTMNGAYTWPRLGYLPEEGPAAPVREAWYHSASARAALRDAGFTADTPLHEVLSTPRGQALWRVHRRPFRGVFDLSPGSFSMRWLEAYLRRRR